MLACVCWAAVVILYLIYTQPYKVVKSCFGPSTQADAKAMMKAIVCLFVAICAIFIIILFTLRVDSAPSHQFVYFFSQRSIVRREG